MGYKVINFMHGLHLHFHLLPAEFPGCFDGFLNVYVLVGHKGEETDYLSSLNESTDYQIPSTVLGMS